MRTVTRQCDNFALTGTPREQVSRFLNQRDQRPRVCVHGRVEVTGRGFHEWSEPACCRIAHKDVQSLKPVTDELHHRAHVVGLTDVGFDRGGTTAERLNFSGDFGSGGLRGHIIDDDVGAGLRQSQRAGTADATGRSRHQRDFSGEINHRFPLSGCAAHRLGVLGNVRLKRVQPLLASSEDACAGT